MVHIKLNLDQDVYAAAHRRAKMLGTSIEELVRGYLRGVAEDAVREPHAEDIENRRGESDGLDRIAAKHRAALRPRDLHEVLADFERRGVGLDMSENQTREEMYDEARRSPDALC